MFVSEFLWGVNISLLCVIRGRRWGGRNLTVKRSSRLKNRVQKRWRRLGRSLRKSWGQLGFRLVSNLASRGSSSQTLVYSVWVLWARAKLDAHRRHILTSFHPFFLCLQLSATLTESIVPFDAASETPLEEQRTEAMIRVQDALQARLGPEALALLRAARWGRHRFFSRHPPCYDEMISNSVFEAEWNLFLILKQQVRIFKKLNPNNFNILLSKYFFVFFFVLCTNTSNYVT